MGAGSELSHSTNIELRRAGEEEEEKENIPRPYLADGGCVNSFKVPKQLGKSSVFLPVIAQIKHKTRSVCACVCTALSKGGMVMRGAYTRLRVF